MKRLTKRQLATTLAALRYWQRTTTPRQRLNVDATDLGLLPEQLYFEDATPLRDEEIDTLCERLNTN